MRDTARQRAIARAWQFRIPSRPRQGRLQRQVRRAFIANDAQPLSMSDLRQWCYPGQPRQHWFYINIKRALHCIGAHQIGRAGGIGRPAIYATYTQHGENKHR